MTIQEKSINNMSIKELQSYISNRINALKREIAQNEKKISLLNAQIHENRNTIKIIERSKDVNYLKILGQQFNLELNPDPLFISLLKTILTDKIENSILLLDEKIKETKKNTMFYRLDLKTIDTCPLCGGMGQKIEAEYIRQGGTVQSIRHITECVGCQGTGKILNISQ